MHNRAVTEEAGCTWNLFLGGLLYSLENSASHQQKFKYQQVVNTLYM
jgi:hypothetical protein